jgi:hypothetical protein
MAGRGISVKKYVVGLSGEERQQPEALIRKGKSPAQRLLTARILLKADVSEAGEGWSEPDHQGAGYQRINDLLGAQATGGRRIRVGVEPQATGGVGGCADFRRRKGSQTDCPGLLQASEGTRALDPAAVGEMWNSTSSIVPATQQSGGRLKNILQPNRRQCWDDEQNCN